jgi:DNA-binding transcriptional ArsR family regulator
MMLAESCSTALKALSDATRWRIVKMLLGLERAHVNELAATLQVKQSNISKHLRILREAGIVVSTKEGTVVWCRIVPEFRQRLRDGGNVLDLGCCTFRFDQAERE